MINVALAVFAAQFTVTAQPAQVWKCKDGERVIFSDVPCPATGKQLEARKLQGNVVQSEPVPAQSEEFDTQSGSSRRRDGASRLGCELGLLHNSNSGPRSPWIIANSADRMKTDRARLAIISYVARRH